jgi:clan AA aspartic protease (TIGR02281 family)
MRIAPLMALVLLFAGLFSSPIWAQNAPASKDDAVDQGPAQVLEAKGLRKQGTAYLLAEEIELTRLAKEVPALQRAVFDAAKGSAQAEQLEAARKEEIDQCTQQQALVASQLSAAASVQEHNKLVVQNNALMARLKQLHEGTDIQKNLDETRQRTASTREAFVENVLKMRGVADQLQADYDALQADSEVAKALAELTSKDGKKMTLGPAPSFKRNIAALKKLEGTVLSESIKLRREGKTYYANVVVGNKPPREFIVDTGATTVTLPWRLAEELNLTPSESSPKVRGTLADGRVVEARRVIAKKMRVGKFSAENVECDVFPADLGETPPLLGMSFLGNYTFRLNAQAATMTMTKVEVPSAQRAKPKKAAR